MFSFQRYLCRSTLLLIGLLPFVIPHQLKSQQPDEQPANPEEKIDFNRDIRPLLSDRCFKCHGPDENSRATDLRLDVRDAAKESLEGESLDEVQLIQRIFSDDESEVMPPPESKLALDDREKGLFKAWIRQGAPYAKHWAFERPQKSARPKVKNESWPQNEIDYHVLSKLEKAGVSPNQAAVRERLIRRVTFDLTGLPPTLAEIDRFVNDSDPRAYEKLVDDLLSRESYGERMTSEWLDVARYSDSFGYQVDRGRHVWPYRDWVINAFNRNMPYRQFIVEQLAGDLLPDADDQQVLATAFNRLHPQKVEGGSVPEEFRVEYVADRTHTFGTAFLGLTLECARCHDHKYDPVSQQEYYQLFAYFNNIDEAGLYSYFTNSTPTPTLLLSSAEQKKRLREIKAKIREKAQQLSQVKVNKESFEAWQKTLTESPLTKPIEKNSFENFKSGNNQSVEGVIGKGVRLTGDDAIGMKTGNFSRNQPFSISIWIKTPDLKDRAVVLHRSRAWTDAASRGYQMLLEEGKLSVSLIHFWPGNAIRVRTIKPLPVNQWMHIGFSYDGSSRAAGIKLFVEGKSAEAEIVRDNLYKNITGGGGDKIAIGQRFRDNGFKDGSVDEVQVFDRQLTEWEFDCLDQQVRDPKSKFTLDALRGQIAQSPEVKKKLQELYRQHYQPETVALHKELKALRDQRSKLVDPTVEIMVMQEMKTRRPTYRLARGAYDQRKDVVLPGLPAVFGATTRPENRLELANWVVSEENPLTARVTVNRYWQMIFGDGLVRTPEDFGSQGNAPTHQELLDWLSRDFIENGWDLKRLLKQMVMSATYRQDSRLNRKLFELDPNNELLARASSFRLPAEMVRDHALATSGLLVNKIGGAGAKPYDLALSFKPVGVDQGVGLYRRSVYTYWKRTGPSPVMMTLDASKRDVCTVKRERTATPLQSFVLMNDPQLVEASRSLAGLVLKETAEPRQAMIQIFRRLTSRSPSENENQILKKLFEQQVRYFQQDPDAMKKFLSVGKRPADQKTDQVLLAALTTVTQTVMNFDESVMRR